MKAYKVLGERIKKIRLDNGLTQQQFAEYLGYTHKSMINKIETGQTEMAFDKIVNLVTIFQVNAAEFLDLSNEEKALVNEQVEEADVPDPTKIHPLKARNESVVYIKPTITRKNIEVGDFSYFDGSNFEKHVTHHYDFIGDKLIIGKFCQIGRNVEFVMNGANHQINSITTYPFYIFKGWDQKPTDEKDLPYKGDTVVGNDVWIGQNVTILPGIHIGDGAIIGANSVVSKDVSPYSVVAGNPIKLIRKRFDDELIGLLLTFKWWNKPIEEIQEILPLLANSNINEIKDELKRRIYGK